MQRSIREYIPKTLDQNLFLLGTYPDYVFNFEGGIKYQWMKEYYPHQYELIKRYIREGRWHVTGSTWDATDPNIPSAESFTRNILYGQHFYRREFGVEGTDIFLPDCFGFGWTLPTIAAHSGLIGFSTQKLMWRHRPFHGTSKIPFEIGLWQGVDGSRIMAVMDAHNYTTKWRYEDLSHSKYLQDIARGYDGHEDLMTTGYFETELKKGESIIFSASLDEMGSTKTIEEVYAASIARRTHKVDFHSCLEHSARQFLIRRPGNRTEVISGYPWHGVSTRQTLVALPGITILQNHKEDCIDALDTLVRDMKEGMFTGDGSAAVAADAPLWFFWTLQELEKEIGGKAVWERYATAMKGILENYRKGIAGRVILNDNGLVWASADQPLTWMDSVIDGVAVTPRNGYQVEVNALWYNAVCYALELAAANGDKDFVKEWKELPERTKASFNELFRLPEGYLADYVGENGPDKSIRPNMIIACGLKYKMLDTETQLEVIRTVRQHLLTPRGLRTLSPRNPLYRGTQVGTPAERDFAGKNGSVWPWLLMFYVRACFDIDGDRFRPQAEEMLDNFNEDIQSYGIGSIAELFDADPPFSPRGAISQAWSVAAVLDIWHLAHEHKAAEKPARAPRKSAAGKSAEKKAATATEKKSTEKKSSATAAEKKPAARRTVKKTEKK